MCGTEELGSPDYAPAGAPAVSGGTDPDFGTLFTVTLNNEKPGGGPRWTPGQKYELTIVNADGQRAVKEFTA